MRWRLYIFFFSATAVFCFMLLTAVTDYGTGVHNRNPLISAATENVESFLASASHRVLPNANPTAPVARAPDLRERQLADPAFKPERIRFYVDRDSDPVLARQEAERKAHENKGKPSVRNRLKWDEHGWYREEVALITAYCPCSKCCGTHSPGITSTGTTAWVAGLAADPMKLSYGTRVFVPGYGLSVVDDTGGAMRRHWRKNGLLHIDVRMTYHYEARQWGKQYLRVRIYDDE